ncbi:MAG: HAD-IIB family hydrolase [Nitrospirota bacterium]
MHKKIRIVDSLQNSKDSPKLLIFTDLDGTLLDSDYSFKQALPALKLIQEKRISLIICSSKTRPEIEKCREKLKNVYPFISENGGGIFIPKNQELKIQKSEMNVKEEEKYYLIRLGADYAELRTALKGLKYEGLDVKGFGDMSIREVAELTGLKMVDARMAKQRDFDEPFIFRGDASSVRKLKRRIKASGYNLTRGEFYHIMGESDKGRGVDLLVKMYKKQYGNIITAALGDSPNDIEMLLNTDYPVVVKKRDGKYDAGIIRNVKGCTRADGVGPDGWNSAVIKLIDLLL